MELAKSNIDKCLRFSCYPSIYARHRRWLVRLCTKALSRFTMSLGLLRRVILNKCQISVRISQFGWEEVRPMDVDSLRTERATASKTLQNGYIFPWWKLLLRFCYRMNLVFPLDRLALKLLSYNGLPCFPARFHEENPSTNYLEVHISLIQRLPCTKLHRWWHRKFNAPSCPHNASYMREGR